MTETNRETGASNSALTEQMLRKVLEPRPYQPIPPAIKAWAERVARPAALALVAEEHRLYPYSWRLKVKLGDRHGDACRVLARGAMGSILVEFADGFQVLTSRFAVRKRPAVQP